MTPLFVIVALALQTPTPEAAAESPTPPGDAAAAPAPAPEAAPAPAPTSGKPRFYVVDPHVVNLAEAVQRTISSAIAQTLEEEGMDAFARDDVREILGQATDLAVIGADAEGLELSTLGQAVGAQWIVAAVVSKLDGAAGSAADVSVQMRLIDVAKSSVAARRETRQSDFDGDLLAAVKEATRLVLAPFFAHMKGTVALTVSEEEADVLVDGQQVGVTPLAAPLSLTGGHHLVTVSKEGFLRHQETVKIEEGTAIVRDVKLRPSPAFAKAWREEGELYRLLAWTTTGLTLLALPAAAAGGGLWYYFGVLEVRRIAAERDSAIYHPDSNPTGLNPAYPDDEALINERYQVPIDKAQFNGQLASVIGIAAGALGVATAATAAYFWIFGKDPARYADFEGNVE